MNTTIRRFQNLFCNQIMQALGDFADVQGVQLYLVGGSVRDILLKRQTTDIDFALETDAIQFAEAFAESIKATCITLKEDPPTARIITWRSSVSRGQPLSIDIAKFRAASLVEDLSLRDLTINAMAIPFENVRGATNKVYEQNAFPVIDPCGGLKDLEAGLLQFLSERAVLADPLRLLRLYRFAAQLNFKISEFSIELARKHRSLLSNVAVERCSEELMKIFNVKKAHLYLQQIAEIGLLTQVVPSMKEPDRFWQSLETFEKSPIPAALHTYRGEINSYLGQKLSPVAYRRSFIKFSLLFREDPCSIGKHLRLSRKARGFMNCLFSGSEIFRKADQHLTERQIIRFLRKYASDWWGILLYTAAAHQTDPELLKQIADTYYRQVLPVHEAGKLITGNELIKDFNLKEGEHIGRLLREVEKRQFYGEIRTREEAFAVIAALLERSL